MATMYLLHKFNDLEDPNDIDALHKALIETEVGKPGSYGGMRSLVLEKIPDL